MFKSLKIVRSFRFSRCIITRASLDKPDLGDYTNIKLMANNLGTSETTIIKTCKRNKIKLLEIGDSYYLSNDQIPAIGALEQSRQLAAAEIRKKADKKRRKILRRNQFIEELLESINPLFLEFNRISLDYCSDREETSVSEIVNSVIEDYKKPKPPRNPFFYAMISKLEKIKLDDLPLKVRRDRALGDSDANSEGEGSS